MPDLPGVGPMREHAKREHPTREYPMQTLDLVFFWSVASLAMSMTSAEAVASTVENLVQQAPLGRAVTEPGYPREFDAKPIRSRYDREENLLESLESLSLQEKPEGPIVELHRLTVYLDQRHRVVTSEWAAGVPRVLVIREDGKGVRVFRALKSASAKKASSFSHPLSDSIFEEQVYSYSEGRYAFRVLLKRDSAAKWAEVSRSKTEIKPVE